MSRASARIENLSRHLTSATGRGTLAKVAVLGASGGIGQPLCMLLKTSKFIGEISLYDVANTPGVAADLGHISSPAAVKAFTGPDELPEALRGCSLVLIPAGIPRKPGMTRDDLFNINASIVAGLCQAVARHCPQAWTAIISNPVNSTVPIAAEVFRAAGVDCSSRLFGVTTLDVVRSETFVSEILGEDPRVVTVPVVGGHAGKTILPLLSQANPALPLPQAGVAKLRDRIQNAGTEVVEAKQGAGSATLSMAYAAARFADACLRAQAGQNLTEYAYVQSSLIPGVPFFASKLQLGPMGIVKECGLGTLSPPEQKALQGMVPELKASITKGVVFAHNFLTKAT